MLTNLPFPDCISSLSVAAPHERTPVFVMPRSSFHIAIERIDNNQDEMQSGDGRLVSIFPVLENVVHETRREVVRTDLTVIRKARKKGAWNFNWNGVKITAPISDPEFYKVCAEHDIDIGPGYVMNGDLTITQHYLAGAKVWLNHDYEITRVHSLGAHSAVGRIDLTTDPYTGLLRQR